MKRLAAWCCVAGGFLWGIKPLYDWLVLGRMINTGYAPSDATDYLKFLFPLLCLGGIHILQSIYKRKVRRSAIILAAAIIFQSLFHFFEIYALDSAIPFGLLFMFSGTVLLLIGAFLLKRELQTTEAAPRPLVRLAQSLFIITLLFCALPFLCGFLSDAIETPILILLMMGVGLIFSAIGLVLLKVIQHDY